MTDEEIVRASVAAYTANDREAAERIFAPGFVFTSPQDDHIDRATWFEVCFPTAGRFVSHELLEIVPTASGVLSLYEYELQNGERYRNAELAVVRDGQIAEVQVFFGGRLV
jgi:ketosteroid isomerase-like protein